MQKIVTIGGGSGQHSILSGLIEFAKKNPDKLKQENISAVVTTFDSGGHTRMLLDARIPKDSKGNFLPPGDIRQCLAAMANNEFAKKSFQYRIQTGENQGAVVGNILLDAGYEQHGDDFEKAIELAKNILDVKGNVYPCTLNRAKFCGELENGYKVDDDEELLVHKSAWYNSPIKKVFIEPEDVSANEKAIKAIMDADKIVLSQGSLFTSLIPNLLVKGIADAIKKSKAKKIYVMNLVTQRGETDGFNAKKHLEIVESYLGKGIIEKIIINSSELPNDLKVKYELEGQRKVIDDLEDERVVKAELITNEAPVLRHDPEKLAEAIIKL